jgi:ABC-type branched-subunit amino acid transport system ATPase component
MSNALILKNISKRFGDIRVLRNICASVPEGKITAFIGPNGAGKTTLFHIIAGSIKPDKGIAIFKGKNIIGLPAHAIAELGVGRQFQDVRVFGGLTVLENVLVGMITNQDRDAWRAWCRSKQIMNQKKKSRSEAGQWLEHVGLQDHGDRLARELSFGQQKLLTLAQLFARRADLLLLDEPTSGLSYQMVEQVCDLIRQAVAERRLTVALVEHNMSVVADVAFWIHFLHEGRIAFSGESQHVLGNRNVREIYMGL